MTRPGGGSDNPSPGGRSDGGPVTGDRTAMRRAMALAAGVRATTSPNPGVGAVVEPGGFAGATQPPGGPHAEVVALREAGDGAAGATLYVTLEPCPMCAGALHAARIGRLVYAAPDPKAGAAGTLYDIPADGRLNHTFPTERGLLETESATLLRAFFSKRRRNPQPTAPQRAG